MLFRLYNPRDVKNFNDYEDYNTIKESLRGTPLLYEDARYVRDGDADIVWKRPKEICKNPYFIKGKPTRFDVLQGEEGDCWAIAVFQLIASNEQLFDVVVPDKQGFGRDYTGAFHFRFFKLGFWYDVVIDDRLPFNKKNYSLQKAHSRSHDVFWGALLEKAFAKFFSEQPYAYDYKSLDSGVVITSFQSVTGGIALCRDLEGPTPFHVFQILLVQSYIDGSLIVASTTDGIEGLLSGHAYIVTQVYLVDDDRSLYNGLRLVKFMNPWGFYEWTGEWSDDDYKRWFEIDIKIRRDLGYVPADDGEFWMSENDFFNYFTFFCVCHLSPRNYARFRQFEDDDRFPWYFTTLRGEWVKNISAGGNATLTRFLNPQYVFTVGQVGEEKIDPCPTIIELTIWGKKSRRDKMHIAFYLYKLKSKHKPPFKQRFFFKHTALNENPGFNSSLSRCYIETFDFELGTTYLLVPCTILANFEAAFLVRIFSHYDVKVFDNSVSKISKSLPTETESKNEVDKELVELFFKASLGEDEINWNGLREILNNVLGKRTGLISYFISYLFKSVIHLFLPNTKYDKRDEGLLFSKDECRRMIAMLDDDHSGKLNFSEFCNLWNKICFWTEVYDQYKEEEYGLQTSELRDALSAIGYDISTHVVHSFSYLYTDEQSYITLKDFILCGVAMETVLPLCATRKIEDENIVFTLHEWVKHTLII